MNKILIVDDYEIIVDMIYSELNETYDCICGYSVNDILKYKDQVDLIVSDYGLFWENEKGQKDFMWSTEVLKDISIPKILITGADPADSHNNFQEDEKHVDFVFFKPLKIDQMKHKIKELLDRRNAQYLFKKTLS